MIKKCKMVNLILLVLFGLIMLFGFVAMLTENGSYHTISIEYLRSLETTLIEVGIFIGGTIGFFLELLYFNMLSLKKMKE